MRIWKLKFELDKYDNLISYIPFSIDEIQMFDGRKFLNEWKARRVVRMEPEKKLPLSDAPGFNLPVFSEKALIFLKSKMKN